MRISGNYFERLLFNVIPWTFLVTLIMFFVGIKINEAFFVFLISTLGFWLLDTLIIYFKFNNPKSLRVASNLIWRHREILSADILTITPIVDKRLRWTFRMIEFVLKDGTFFYIIDKPQNVIANLLDRQSKTVNLLLKEFPDFWGKLESVRYI